MQLELLGHINLAADLVEPHLSKFDVEFAVGLDWTIAYAGWSSAFERLPVGCSLASLIRTGN